MEITFIQFNELTDSVYIAEAWIRVNLKILSVTSVLGVQ